MSYQPKTIIQLSEDKEIVSHAISYIESIESEDRFYTQKELKKEPVDNDALGVAMIMDGFIAGVQSREVYIGNLHDNVRELIERFNKLDAEFIKFKKLHGFA